MGTKAETIRVSARPAGFTLWTAAVSALAAAALIMSAVALTVASRDRAVTGVAGGGIHEAASTEAPLWDAGRLEAMEGRVLAESIRSEGYASLWDEGKLAAMQGRVLAESVRSEGYAPLWDAGKLAAMKGRVLAESIRIEDPAVLWDPGRLEAMEGRVLAG